LIGGEDDALSERKSKTSALDATSVHSFIAPSTGDVSRGGGAKEVLTQQAEDNIFKAQGSEAVGIINKPLLPLPGGLCVRRCEEEEVGEVVCLEIGPIGESKFYFSGHSPISRVVPGQWK